MDIQYEIMEHVTNLSEKSNTGWVKQLNRVKWSNNNPVWDIRSWRYPDTSNTPDRMSKGVTLSDAEMNALADYLKKNHLPPSISSDVIPMASEV